MVSTFSSEPRRRLAASARRYSLRYATKLLPVICRNHRIKWLALQPHPFATSSTVNGWSYSCWIRCRTCFNLAVPGGSAAIFFGCSGSSKKSSSSIAAFMASSKPTGCFSFSTSARRRQRSTSSYAGSPGRRYIGCSNCPAARGTKYCCAQISTAPAPKNSGSKIIFSYSDRCPGSPRKPCSAPGETIQIVPCDTVCVSI